MEMVPAWVATSAIPLRSEARTATNHVKGITLMALHSGSPTGTVISKSTFQGTTATPNTSTTTYTVGVDVYEDFDHVGGTAAASRGSRLKFRAGQQISVAEYNAVYSDLGSESVSTITPSAPTTIPAAGGTTITATGVNLYDCTGVTMGGTAATALTVVNDGQITFVSPAKVAGTYDTVFLFPGGNVTKTGAAIYV